MKWNRAQRDFIKARKIVSNSGRKKLIIEANEEELKKLGFKTKTVHRGTIRGLTYNGIEKMPNDEWFKVILKTKKGKQSERSGRK